MRQSEVGRRPGRALTAAEAEDGGGDGERQGQGGGGGGGHEARVRVDGVGRRQLQLPRRLGPHAAPGPRRDVHGGGGGARGVVGGQTQPEDRAHLQAADLVHLLRRQAARHCKGRSVSKVAGQEGQLDPF